MSVSIPRSIGRAVPISEDAPESSVQRFRDAIASRSGDYAEAFPHAADFEARLLQVLYEAINGEAVNLRGIRSVEGFRGALRGEKNFHLADLCCLATSPTREARAAVKAVAQELAAAVGYRLETLAAGAADAHEVLGDVIEAAGHFGSDMSRKLINDGVIDGDEARDLRPGLEQLKAKVARAEAVISEAERATVRK